MLVRLIAITQLVSRMQCWVLRFSLEALAEVDLLSWVRFS